MDREHYKPRPSVWTWVEAIAIVVGAAFVIGAVLTGHTLDFYGR